MGWDRVGAAVADLNLAVRESGSICMPEQLGWLSQLDPAGFAMNGVIGLTLIWARRAIACSWSFSAGTGPPAASTDRASDRPSPSAPPDPCLAPGSGHPRGDRGRIDAVEMPALSP